MHLIKAVYTTIGIGVCLYYFFAFGPIGSLDAERVIGVLLALCLIEAGMSIIDGLVGWNLWDDNGWQFDGERRAVATLALPAGLGVFIGMGIAFALSLLVWRGPTRLRALAIATVVVGLPGCLLHLYACADPRHGHRRCAHPGQPSTHPRARCCLARPRGRE